MPSIVKSEIRAEERGGVLHETWLGVVRLAVRGVAVDALQDGFHCLAIGNPRLPGLERLGLRVPGAARVGHPCLLEFGAVPVRLGT